MRHKYKHKIDLSQLEEIATGNAALEAKYMRLLIAYARELEARVARMREVGDALTKWFPDVEGYYSDERRTEIINKDLEAWRNA